MRAGMYPFHVTRLFHFAPQAVLQVWKSGDPDLLDFHFPIAFFSCFMILR